MKLATGNNFLLSANMMESVFARAEADFFKNLLCLTLYIGYV